MEVKYEPKKQGRLNSIWSAAVSSVVCVCVCVCVYAVVTPTGAGEPWSDAGNALSCDSSNTDGTHTNCLWCCVRYPCVYCCAIGEGVLVTGTLKTKAKKGTSAAPESKSGSTSAKLNSVRSAACQVLCVYTQWFLGPELENCSQA